jgi:acyl carrier protein
MTDEEILERISTIVRDELDNDDVRLSMDTVAKSVQGWDSLAHVRIVIAVERAFGARFGTNEITGLRNVGELVQLVHQSQSN